MEFQIHLQKLYILHVHFSCLIDHHVIVSLLYIAVLSNRGVRFGFLDAFSNFTLTYDPGFSEGTIYPGT